MRNNFSVLILALQMPPIKSTKFIKFIIIIMSAKVEGYVISYSIFESKLNLQA